MSEGTPTSAPPAPSGPPFASEFATAHDPERITSGAYALRAIDPPLDAWAEPTAGPDPRPVYNRPTSGHPPSSMASVVSALAGPAGQVPAGVTLFPAGMGDHSRALAGLPTGVASAQPAPTCISPPRPDGHTRARITADPAGFSEQLAALVAELREPRTPEQEAQERREGLLVRALPTPSWPQGATVFEVKVSGVRRHAITLYAHDRVHIFLNAETGELRIDWKAKELWAHSWAVTAGRWLSDLSLLLFGEACTLDRSYALGWRMTGIELCADFVGFPIRPEDCSRFAGGLKNSAIGMIPDMQIEGFGYFPAETETINLGKRSGNVSLCIYDKSTQIRDDKGGDDACYRSGWDAGGYDGASPITRVELRLSRFGLTLATPDPAPGASAHSEIVHNFRDPATLADPKKIGIVWRHCTGRHRLVLGERSRIRRDAIDPRWEPVIASGGAEPPALRQFRAIQEDAWKNKVDGAARRLVRSACQLAGLHGLDAKGPTGAATIARFAYALAEAAQEDLETYAASYYALCTPFVGPEIWSLGQIQWRDYRGKVGGAGIATRNLSFWTQRASLDRALSKTGPPNPQPREEENTK